jgi:hypothetical protein
MSKVDSNLTGLRYAEEASVGVLPGSPVWHGLEPNSYDEFGSEITTTARAPITAGRQRKKGVVTDLNASAGFEMDFTQTNLYDMLQGFFFADWRKKPNQVFTAINGTTEVVTVASETGFDANDLVLLSGSSIAANDGLALVSAVASGAITLTKDLTTDASPASDATIRVVGHQFASGDAEILVTGSVAQLTTTTKDLTQLSLIPGEWVYIGGDSAGTEFAQAANNGWARVSVVTANAVTFDKTQGTMVTDDGTGKTIRIFVGDAIKNESDPALIVRRSYQLERSLSTAGYEYVLGSVPNELTFNFGTSDKATVSLGFVSTDSETIDDPMTPKSGSRPDIPVEDAFNTSSDIGRLRVAGSAGTALAAYFTEASLTIMNGLSPNKALGVLGAFDLTAGDFMVSAEVEGYFSTVVAVAAVRANEDATYDFALVKANAGWVFDIPLVSLGNARLNVEKDQPIKLPLSIEGAESDFGHTLLANRFWYLPDAAE